MEKKTSSLILPDELPYNGVDSNINVNSDGAVPRHDDDDDRVQVNRLRQYYCSFDVKCHPKQASLEEQSRAWLTGLFKAHGLPRAQLKRLLEFRYARLSCMFYPSGTSEARSFTLVKLVHWALLVDDLLDDHLACNPAAARAFCSRLLLSMFGPSAVTAAGLQSSSGNIHDDLKGIPDEELSKQQELVIEVGVQWSSEMQAQGMSPKQYGRVQEAVVGYLTAVLTLLVLRGQNKLPSLSDYVFLRRMDGAFDIGLLGCEFDLNMELDDETLSHMLIQELHKASSDHFNWINDVLSFDSEYHKGDYINLITILYHQNNHVLPNPAHEIIDFQEALSRACTMIKAKDRDSLRLSSEISVWSPSLKPYVGAVHHLVSGITAWTLGSPRYRKGICTIPTNKRGYEHHQGQFKFDASLGMHMCLQ